MLLLLMKFMSSIGEVFSMVGRGSIFWMTNFLPHFFFVLMSFDMTSTQTLFSHVTCFSSSSAHFVIFSFTRAKYLEKVSFLT